MTSTLSFVLGSRAPFQLWWWRKTLLSCSCNVKEGGERACVYRLDILWKKFIIMFLSGLRATCQISDEPWSDEIRQACFCCSQFSISDQPRSSMLNMCEKIICIMSTKYSQWTKEENIYWTLQSGEKLSAPHDSDKLQVIVFCMTSSLSHIVVERFWPAFLFNVASVHWGLCVFTQAHLSSGPITAYKI